MFTASPILNDMIEMKDKRIYSMLDSGLFNVYAGKRKKAYDQSLSGDLLASLPISEGDIEYFLGTFKQKKPWVSKAVGDGNAVWFRIFTNIDGCYIDGDVGPCGDLMMYWTHINMNSDVRIVDTVIKMNII